MTTPIFITGTDTNVGKTYISCSILAALNSLGFNTIGLKPIASGCTFSNGQYYNDDAIQLQQASSIHLDYNIINPIALPMATAPHIAAAQINRTLTVSTLSNAISPALNHPADFHLIEGVGGWLVPLNTNETMADFVRHQQFPVLLIVGIRLGCLNHALLTYRSLLQYKIPIIGWIANCIDPEMLLIKETIDYLSNTLPISFFGSVGFNEKNTLQIDALLDKAGSKAGSSTSLLD